METLVRLSKRMAELGLCSRREADEYIVKGWVSVDGNPVNVLGTKVLLHQQITLHASAQRQQQQRITILLNKPVGYVSAQAERGYPAAVTLITPANRYAHDRYRLSFRPEHSRGLAPAGRLDIDSTGLLILTQDGVLARHIIGEESTVDKEYIVRIDGKLSPQGLKLLNDGLRLDGEPLRPALVRWQGAQVLNFVLRQGKKRQIRRMCELVGVKVISLTRIRIGNIHLGNLPKGQWRYLDPTEVN